MLEQSAIDKAVSEALERARLQLIAEMRANGKYVSGRTAGTLHVKGKDLWGASYFDVMLDGRAGGGIPYGFRQILLAWAKQKGITFSDSKEANRWAYFTAKKIKAEGTKQYREHQHIDLYSSVVSTLTNEVKELLKSELKDSIIRLNYERKVR